jgi:hypothetical protein
MAVEEAASTAGAGAGMNLIDVGSSLNAADWDDIDDKEVCQVTSHAGVGRAALNRPTPMQVVQEVKASAGYKLLQV